MRRSDQKGNSLVEFALSITLIVVLFSGAFQFGFAFHTYNQLEAAVRSGARYGSIQVYNSSTTTPSTSFSTAVKNMVVYGTPTVTGSETPIVSGLTTSHVTVTPLFRNNAPVMIQVGITGFPLNAIFQTYNLTNKPNAAFPFLGVYAPI